MKNSRFGSLNCIKPNANKVVKPTLWNTGVWTAYFYLILFGVPLSASVAWGIDPKLTSITEDRKPASDQEEEPESDDKDIGPLPEIEARSFGVKVLERSTSNRVYLFEDTNSQNPTPGRILLLRREGESIMGFRVLKNYPEKRQFAARRVRRYKSRRVLENEESFLALEKLSDLGPLVPSDQDNADLKELEGKREKLTVSAFDPELDKETSPLPDGEHPQRDQEGEEQLDPDKNGYRSEISIEETQIIDHNSHWITAGIGFLMNSGPPNVGGSHYFSAGNLRYGISFLKLVFLDQPRLQDSFVLEGGTYFYKALNYIAQGDAYTVLSIVGALRYNVMFSESFGFFIYTGLLDNMVIQANVVQSDATSSLTNFAPAAGAGLLLELGPSWYTRIDVGLESIGFNLVLRF